MVAFKSMREPSGVFQCVSQRRGCGTARGLPAGNGRGSLLAESGNILGFWLVMRAAAALLICLSVGLRAIMPDSGIGEPYACRRE